MKKQLFLHLLNRELHIFWSGLLTSLPTCWVQCLWAAVSRVQLGLNLPSSHDCLTKSSKTHAKGFRGNQTTFFVCFSYNHVLQWLDSTHFTDHSHVNTVFYGAIMTAINRSFNQRKHPQGKKTTGRLTWKTKLFVSHLSNYDVTVNWQNSVICWENPEFSNTVHVYMGLFLL